MKALELTSTNQSIGLTTIIFVPKRPEIINIRQTRFRSDIRHLCFTPFHTTCGKSEPIA